MIGVWWRIVKGFWRGWRKERRYNHEVTVMWKKEKSQEKGKAAATRAAVGTGGGAGVALMVIALVESVFALDVPDTLEKFLVAAAAFVAGPVWTFLKTYYADKAKHGGAEFKQPGYLPGFIPLFFLAVLAWSACGCASHVCRLKETVTDSDGVTTVTNVQDYSWAWWKSTLDEGAGNVKYQFDENNVIELGSTSTGLAGGDATDLFLGMVQMMAPIVGDWVAGRQQIGVLNAQKKSLLEQLIEASKAQTPAVGVDEIPVPAE